MAQRIGHRLRLAAAGQVHEPLHGQRQRRINVQALRDIADGQVRRAGDGARHRRQRAYQPFEQRGLSRPVRSDDGHNLARVYGEIDVAQHGGAALGQRHAVRFDQRGHAAAS